MNPEEQGFCMSYDDVADFVFQSLANLGYVPTSDEVLDISDIVFGFTIHLIKKMGIDVHEFGEEDDE